MFNTLASYLLGTSSNNNADNIKNEENTILADSTQKHLNIIATECDDEEDDDWLLVHKDDSAPQPDSEEELQFVEIKNAPVLHRNRHSRNNSGAGSHDGLLNLTPTSILPNSMEESWFVTPPPCFTSTGPIIMETSPLENLLIEHPSMSVYHNVRRSSFQNVDDDIEDILDLEFGLEIIHPAAERSPTHTVRLSRARSDHNERLGHHQLKQYVLLKNSQKTRELKNRQTMCRSALERGNKVREVNSKGGRQKRSDMNHCKVLSRANNNRKC